MLDSSDLRKPGAQAMEALMQVRDLEGRLVPGYRVLTALGIAPEARGLLYHRLFSSHEPGFESEPAEVQQAVRSVQGALGELEPSPEVTWLLDRAFDDEALWGVVWQAGDHLLVRLQHLERSIEAPAGKGRWRRTRVARYGFSLPEMARVRTEMTLRLGRQRKPRRQEVTVILYAGRMRVRFRVGRQTSQEPQTRQVWLVRAQVLGSDQRWWLMTDHPVETAEEALRIFHMYRMRWAVEDAFKFIKQALGWEQVQVLSLEGVRFLVALAAVAAGFLFECGVSLEWEAVRLLAQLGGWVPRKNARPGKMILTRGLRRILDALAVRAQLREYLREHGQLPSQTQAYLPDDFW